MLFSTVFLATLGAIASVSADICACTDRGETILAARCKATEQARAVDFSDVASLREKRRRGSSRSVCLTVRLLKGV
jgi:hypothetical protein